MIRNLQVCLVLAAGLLPALARAQADAAGAQVAPAKLPLAFDVVSIKPDKSEAGPFTIGFPADGDGFAVTNIPLAYIIQFAYNFERGDLVSGMPEWAKTERYDIQAKVAETNLPVWGQLSDDLRRVMVQGILAERFKLSVHRAPAGLPVYTLVVGKNGPKMKEAKPGDGNLKGPDGNPIRGMLHTGLGQYTAQDESMADLSLYLSDYVGRQVIDQTGLTGHYDFKLQFAPEPGYGPEAHQRGSAPAAEAEGPSVYTAVQEQLGLKLEATKASVDGLVVDHVERPAGN